MEYISVKEAAKKFGLSVRRVQALCDEGRIKGCARLSGVWIIPSDATKPNDERLAIAPKDNDYLSLNDFCEQLGISSATGRNWIKLGKIVPDYVEKKNPFFSKTNTAKIKRTITSGENKILKSRRNKRFISGNYIYKSYVSESCTNLKTIQALLDKIVETDAKLDENLIKCLIADCALKLFSLKQNLTVKDYSGLFKMFTLEEFSIGKYDIFIKDILESIESPWDYYQNNQELFNFDYEYEDNEDILGLIYISCKNIAERKAVGSYYTPTTIVKDLIDNLHLNQTKGDILDPCCGTGNFLLQLPESIPLEQIYGNDLDEICIKIARINLALKFQDASIGLIYDHVTNKNFLTDFEKEHIQYIVGNPPWGYEFSFSEKADLKDYKTAQSKTIESYDVFIEKSLSILNQDGKLAFVLPEAMLNVKSHKTIRQIIMDNNAINRVKFLGNAFDGVQCPCIIFEVKHTCLPLKTFGIHIEDLQREYTILTERKINSDYFSFGLNDEEYKIVEKIKNHQDNLYLKDHADFALGIVTGSNADYLTNVKTDENEMILKGSDIVKYHINPSDNYIVYEPNNFQQVAPTEMYRAKEKIFYRFICNQLVFAYDDKQTLSLNSCNIVIPHLENVDMKYILAIFNSSVAQFLFQKEFNSVKILRSHIESLPIPMVNEDIQNHIIDLVKPLIHGLDIEETIHQYQLLDRAIFELFELDENEIATILKATTTKNKFLI